MPIEVVRDHIYLGKSGTVYNSLDDAYRMYLKRRHTKMEWAGVELFFIAILLSAQIGVLMGYPGMASGMARFVLGGLLVIGTPLLVWLFIHRLPLYKLLFDYVVGMYNGERHFNIMIESGDIRVIAPSTFDGINKN